MGQASSVTGCSPELTRHHSTCSPRRIPPMKSETENSENEAENDTPTTTRDFISDLPDECLAHIFQSLTSGERKSCSVVCKRWLKVEGQSRQRLSLNAQSELYSGIPSLFARFDSVTKLALRCNRRSISISDDALVLVSLRCRNLSRLKLRGCRELTDFGIAAFAENCKNLKKLSCGSCDFGTNGLNSVLQHCSLLEELSIKRLRGINDNGTEAAQPISPGLAAKSLRSICLKELYNGQLLGPLIIGSKNLRTLKLIKCMGDWDSVLELMANSNDGLVEIHLERLQVTDTGLSAISNCVNLEILHIVKIPDCSNLGIVSIAERCTVLRKVHIDGWRTNRIGDEGLAALGKNCSHLQELVLIGLNPTALSLEVIASNCQNLERLALCSSETIRDGEISCVVSKCAALKKFCIKSCPITDNGLEALAWGCPNLVKVKVKKCREVTHEILEWLRLRRESLVVNLDVDEIEAVDAASASDSGGGAQEDGLEVPSTENQATNPHAPERRNARRSLFKAKFGFLKARKIAAYAKWWSSGIVNSSTTP
ncbi:hypothetical protein Nepgr_016654 [Nepenthes gracilis]|uniref:F-box domain-containing protein n=1 Tax=Nepenthes gracilis TaxID=150966 RepID=A0AAD3SNZ6_NEPGR|nr:hypothetical protein Nepgr_016654 [Nepenthes gracilis]